MNRKPIITSPCTESWDHMTPTQQGRFCQKCELEVVDFTNSNSAEIVAFIDDANGRVCGRMKVKPLNYLAYASALSSLLLGGFANQAFGQENVIMKGKVAIQDEDINSNTNENGDPIEVNHIKNHIGTVVNKSNEPIPFSIVWVNGEPKARTDFDGKFSLDLNPVDYGHEIEIEITNSSEYEDTIRVKYYFGEVPLQATYVFQEQHELQIMLGVVVAEPRRSSPFGQFGNENTFDMDEERPRGRSNKRR